jgi:hypothetical protein
LKGLSHLTFLAKANAKSFIYPPAEAGGNSKAIASRQLLLRLAHLIQGSSQMNFLPNK